MKFKNFIAVLLAVFFITFVLYLFKTLTQIPSTTGYFVYQPNLTNIFVMIVFVMIFGIIGVYFYFKSSE